MVFAWDILEINPHLPEEARPARRLSNAALQPKRRAATGKASILYLLFWVSLAIVAYFGMNALTAPKIANIAMEKNGAMEIVIPRSRNGHYFVEGAINGHAITFMVDTGASTVAIDKQIARAANLPTGFPATFSTASGNASGATVPRQRVSIGGLSFDDVSIAVIDGVGEVGLLGQNILRHLEVTQSNDQLILRTKSAPASTR